MQSISEQIDSYVKRTIVNAVKDFKKFEVRKSQKEVSIDDISNNISNDETAILSYMDNYAVFSLHLEDVIEDEQLYKIIKSLSEEFNFKPLIIKSSNEGEHWLYKGSELRTLSNSVNNSYIRNKIFIEHAWACLYNPFN